MRMGLVAFRDKGDDYVTKVTPLSENLDRVFNDLSALSAGGGGDGPEHVIAGLSDAVEKMSWSEDAKAFKVVYLVGDAAPHEDYPDAPKLTAVLEKAVRKGLIINSLQCGADSSATAAFTKVARLGEGRFMPVAQDGGAVAVATPFDERLAEASGKLEGTLLAYGSGGAATRADMALAAAVRGMAAAPAAAERAVYKAREGFSTDKDLARAVAENKVDLAKLKEEETPEPLRGLSLDEKKAKLAAIEADRRELRAEVASLESRRAAWLKKQTAGKPADAFDAKLVDALKAQAAKKGIRY
ncbi:MAG: VWA domain-containing protein [Elusimicrobiota bacterium]|nr:VWA domain-containing protein [Elusimicrobiota bacterium]